ncbi:MAG TPA: alpha-galactosidase [Bacteroidales bacterium]|nr:alpha-galactosidase [Bacteroidales bacterium]
MKRYWIYCLLFLLSTFRILSAEVTDSSSRVITISTAHSAITLYRAADDRIYQLGYGDKSQEIAIPAKTPGREDEFFPSSGNGFIWEPALQAFHADGNTSTDLIYVNHSTSEIDKNVTLTRIELKDSHYPFFVTLCFKCYQEEDLMEQWTEIAHQEASQVTLFRFASSSPVIRAKSYWVSQFYGNWAKEFNFVEEQLTPGIKVFDSKLGVRAQQMRNPSFILSLNGPAKENSGDVFGGTLGWSGSFQLSFEIDNANRLRSLNGINPFGSQYRLQPGVTFKTPSMFWTYSNKGKGQVSRNFHRWALKYGIRDGQKPRPVLVNNWEATGMNFNESTIVSLFDGAKEIGADLFLLDDGWFANKYPRDNAKAGLGDWEVNKAKLPQGLPYLAKESKKRGIGFGIWIEPEMVNPKTELYEKHPEWAIGEPYREPLLSRNQLILDLTRPEVKDYVWKVIDQTFSSSTDITYTKWDCNRFVTQPGSTYLSPENQSHLLIDYNFALYDIMDKMAKKYTNIMAMVCSGGGGRVDYGALKYFHSFWPSDNTDPIRRVFMQWGYSHFFPANTIAAHVTNMGKRPLRFAINVAMSGAMGVDLDIRKMSAEDRVVLSQGVKLYKERLRNVVQQGDLYRMDSPYDGPRATLDYVTYDQSRAVLFVYQLKDGTPDVVKPMGLDPLKNYRVTELNVPDGQKSRMILNGTVKSGAELMRDGFVPTTQKEYDSMVIEFSAVTGKKN